jgi:hypothetical protein
VSVVRRFFQIGRAEPEPAGAETAAPKDASLGGRFGLFTPDGSPGAPAVAPRGGHGSSPSSATADRFGGGSRRIELATDDDDEQTFVRCAHCHADSNRHATTCQVCGLSLDTDEQRRYNAELWPRVREEVRHAREEAEERRRESERRFALEIAERVRRDALRAREDAEATRGLGSVVRGRQPSLGLSWLRRIPDPRVRLAVLVGLVALPFLLWQVAPALGVLCSLAICAVFLPRMRKRFWD